MKYLIFIMIILFSGNVYGMELEPKQKKLLQYAYEYGNSISYKNQGWGETIASILFQESKAGYSKYKRNGVIVGDKDRKGRAKSLGVMQVQIGATRDVLRWYPQKFVAYFGNHVPTDEELINLLLVDYEFNIRVGTWYFIKMLELKNDNWREAILAYNAGANNKGIDYNDYVNKVLHWRTLFNSNGIFN